MEGALASVIGGLIDCPVIAVPTSVGYGASFHGVSALLTMIKELLLILLLKPLDQVSLRQTYLHLFQNNILNIIYSF